MSLKKPCSSHLFIPASSLDMAQNQSLLKPCMSFQLSSPNRRPHKDITRFVNGQTQRKTFLHNYTAFKIRFSFNFISASQPVWPDGQIIFQHLAIYNNENLPNCAKFGSQLCQITRKTLKRRQIFLKFLSSG